MIDIILA